MDSVRTDEQKTSDVELEEAVMSSLRAYNLIEDGEILSDFVILTATSKIHADGVVQTDYPFLVAGGDIPWYRALGLINVHTILANRQVGNDNG